MTLVCIPTLNDKGLMADISIHFGKTPYFTFIEFNGDELENINIIDSYGKHNGGSKTSAEIILSSEIDVLICGNLGQKAISMMNANGIKVFSGASGSVDDILKKWKKGLIKASKKSFCTEKGC